MVSPLVQQVDDRYRHQPIDGANMVHHHFRNYVNPAPNLTKTINDAHDNGFLASVSYLKRFSGEKEIKNQMKIKLN